MSSRRHLEPDALAGPPAWDWSKACLPASAEFNHALQEELFRKGASLALPSVVEVSWVYAVWCWWRLRAKLRFCPRWQVERPSSEESLRALLGPPLASDIGASVQLEFMQPLVCRTWRPSTQDV